jgi:hypothetical protein
MPTSRVALVGMLAIVLAMSASAVAQCLRVRPMHAELARLIEEGHERSSLFRLLVAQIERSNLIVHVVYTPRPRPGADGYLRLVSSTATARYVRIAVRSDLSAPRAIGLIGHELMHAAELAAHSEVRDNAALRKLYERIGHSHDGWAFETNAAIAAGRRVLAEVMGTDERQW